MFTVFRRYGLPLERVFALLVVLAAIGIGTALWVGPLQPVPAELQLLALGEDGRFATTARLRRAIGDTVATADQVRFPLLLGARNTGARAAAPNVLALSIPAHYRLTDGTHTPLRGQRTPNNPLVRYRIGLHPQRLDPGDAPTLLTTTDTLWLEPRLPAYYCTLSGDGVPEFVPAPAHDPARLATVSIFYSFFGGDPGVRQSGLLVVVIDSAALARQPAPAPPSFTVTLVEPAAPMPELGALARGGFVPVQCGDPAQPIELQSVLWLTASGGRFIVLYHAGVPRKYLFDLDADGVVELEMWDPDGDGEFEARRQARFALPDYLLPPPSPADTLRVDSVWLARFHDTATGPYRFLPDSLRPAPPQPAAAAPQPRPPPRPAADTPRIDTLPRPAPPPPDTTRSFLSS